MRKAFVLVLTMALALIAGLAVTVGPGVIGDVPGAVLAAGPFIDFGG